MSEIFNFALVGAIVVVVTGGEVVKIVDDVFFPVQRSAQFSYYSIAPTQFEDGRPCRVDNVYAPVMTAKQRARDCWSGYR